MVTADEVTGPYFFENEEGENVTVTGARYRQMLEDLVRPWVQNKPPMWFQQDGAMAHKARKTLNLLQDIFGNRIISRGCEINWPPRSPNLTCADFFLWVYLKERVYANKPATINALKNNIEEEIRAISPETLSNVLDNALQRAQECENENGAHLSNIIFHN